MNNFRALIKEFPNAVRKRLDVSAVLLWAHDPVNRRLILVASSEMPVGEVSCFVVDVPQSLVGRCVESKDLELPISLQETAEDDRTDPTPNITADISANWMFAYPVLNSTNRNQVLYLIDIRASTSTSVDQNELREIGKFFGKAYESLLFEHCFRVGNILRIDFSAKIADGTLNDLYRMLTKMAAHETDSDAAIVFVRTSAGELEPRGFDARNIIAVREFFEDVFKVGEETVTTNRGQIKLQRAGGTVSVSLVSVVIRDFAGQAVGSIVCIKKPKLGHHTNAVFSPDDVTICESLGDAFAPFYELLSNEEDRFSAWGRLGHELKGPVTGMKSAVAFARRAIKKEPQNLERYLADLDSFTAAMTDLLANAELISEGREAKLNFEPVDLVRDILTPATRAIELSCEAIGVSGARIRRPGLVAAPKLQLDKARMLQVALNLLDNAIKYSIADQQNAWIEVTFAEKNGRYELSIRDWGIGVPLGFEYRVFSMGVRAPNAVGKAGKGFGLAVSRGIVRAHGGDIEYRRHPDGSEFVIVLPLSLKAS